MELLEKIFSAGTLFTAITLGAVYALMAVGYTMVYGIIKLINFAHGEIFMLGTFAGLLLATNLGFPIALAILAAMLLCALLGIIIDFSAYLPLRRKHPLPDAISVSGLVVFGFLAIAYFRIAHEPEPGPAATLLAILLALVPLVLFTSAILGLGGKFGRPRATVVSDRLSALITAIGTSLSLQTIAQLIWTANPRSFPEGSYPAFFDRTVFELGNANVQGKEVITWAVAIVVMLLLHFIVHRTRVGKAMRACAIDKDTASLMGVNVNLVIAVTFALGSAMAAVAGIFWAIKKGGDINPRFGYYPGVIAFAAAVLGGIGNIRGALIGGFLIGIMTAVAQVISPAYDIAYGFGLMILVILFRPWGILGKPEAKRA